MNVFAMAGRCLSSIRTFPRLRIAGLPAAWLAFPLVLLALGGCGRPAAKPAAADAVGLTDVQLMLNWYPEAEHGGYYAALEHGYFEEEGLRVTIVPGGPNAPVVQRVARRSVEFGVTNADRILMGVAQGAPLQALLAPLQTSPRCVLVHQQSGITSFEQLENVTLMMARENGWAQFLIQKLPLKGVDIVPNSSSLAPFLANPRSAKQGYVFSEPFLAEAEGAKVTSLLVADLGFNPYTSVLTAHEALRRERPELVEKMVRASRRGWLTYLESPERTNARIHQLNPAMSPEILAFGVQAMKQYCLGERADADSFGQMSLQRWQTLTAQLVDLMIIPPGKVDPASVLGP